MRTDSFRNVKVTAGSMERKGKEEMRTGIAGAGSYGGIKNARH